VGCVSGLSLVWALRFEHEGDLVGMMWRWRIWRLQMVKVNMAFQGLRKVDPVETLMLKVIK
jgi:hypothetical protein